MSLAFLVHKHSCQSISSCPILKFKWTAWVSPPSCTFHLWWTFNILIRASQWLSGKGFACNAGAAGVTGSILGSGRSPGGWHGNPLQYSCLENTMDRGAWHSTVIGLWRIRHNWIDLACTYTYLTYRLWFFYSCNYWSLFSPFLFYIRHVWFGTSFAVQGLRPCCRFNPWPGSSTCL